MPCWTYVEVWKIGKVTAPASGSGSWPAWMALVARRWAPSESVIRVTVRSETWSLGEPYTGGGRSSKAGGHAAGRPVGSHAMEARRVRCLVVDDEARIRDVMARVLEGEGFECTEASSGPEAVALLDAHAFDLAVLDIQMPGMDGTQLLAEIRLRWPTTGVVMVTAVSDVHTAVACLTHGGALDYVAKPFEIDEVRARVRQALEKRRLIRENREYQLHLESRVQEQADRIEELFVLGVQSLVQALEAKD